MENQTLFTINSIYKDSSITFLKIAALTSLTALIINHKKTRPIDWLLLGSSSLLIVFVFRNIPIFVFYAYYLTISAISSIWLSHKKLIYKFINSRTLTILKNFSLILLILITLKEITIITERKGFGFGIDERGKKAIDFFKENKLKGPIFNDFNIGSYITYRLFPQTKIFVDGRAEAYPKKFFQNEYLPALKNPKLFDKIDRKYKFNTIIVQHWDQTATKNNFLIYLLEKPDFSLVYLDDYSIILLKNTKENQKIIQKYRLKENNFIIPLSASKKQLVRYVYAFEKINWQSKKKTAYQRLLSLDPQNCLLQTGLNALRQPINLKGITLKKNTNCL